MICLLARSVADTEAIGAAIAPLLAVGDCVVLAGEMGAGKTTFTRALGAAFGVDEPVTSPTFTLVHSYRGARLTVHHADVYRLERMAEVADLAFDELLDDGVLVVEWGDAVRDALPASRLEVALSLARPGTSAVTSAATTVDASTSTRHVAIDAVGPRWERRAGKLAEALTRWSAPC